MQEISREQGLWLAAQALIVMCRVRDKRYPVLAEVTALDPDLGKDMSFLGYTEFTPELLKAMVMKKLGSAQEGPALLRNQQINNFLRDDDVTNCTF